MFKNKFKTNVGDIDRIVRIAVGLALIAVFFFFTGATGWAFLWLIVGVIALATGLVRSCPVYSMLGYSTCKVEQA